MRMSSPWKHPSTGTYYYRRAVPQQHRAALGWEVKISLKTKDPEEAKRRYPGAASEFYRRVREAEHTDDPAALRRKAKEWVAGAVAMEGSRDAVLDHFTPASPDWSAKPPAEQLSEGMLDTVFGKDGWRRNEPEARKAAWEAIHAEAQQAHTLEDAFDAWAKERGPTEKTKDEWKRCIERFGAYKHVKRITRADVLAFKDQLLDRGLAKGTIRKQLTALRTVFQYAVHREWRPDNPVTGVKVMEAKTAPEARLPYGKPELEAIFSGPVHAQGKRPKGGAGEAALWLPILALYTGARLSELGQLRVADVQEQEGVHFIVIGDSGEGQRVKTAGSRRRVPLHPDIRKQFLAYVRGLPVDGLLFPKLKAGIYDDVTHYWSKWWGRYQRNKLKITDRRHVFHSFRHAFKNLCREAGIPEEAHDQLTGHSAGSVGRSYGGKSLSLRKLAEYIAAIRVPVKPSL
jgi:integrase